MALLTLPLLAYTQGGGPGGNCNPISVDLRGQPAGVFDTSNIRRTNPCCNGNSCLQFLVQLDPKAIAYTVEVTSGAVPGGSLTYEVDCNGNPQFPGNTVCVNNKDSFSITFCKPGNNPNSYRISSKPKPSISADSIVYDGCGGLMVTDSLTDSTIQWSSVAGKPAYDSFLTCTYGCDSTNIELENGFPDSIQYQVSGVPVYQCATDTVYDTTTVYLRDSLTADIQIRADSLTCVSPADSATLVANVKGGDPPYHYQWNTGDNTQTLQTDTGQYGVTVTDAGYCAPASDTFQLTAKAIQPPMPEINGPDTICQPGDTFRYHTTGDTSSAYQWQVSGPGTLLSGKNEDSVAIRWDSTGEAPLTLTQTNQVGCDSVLTDTITISQEPNPAIQGPDTVCAYTDSLPYKTSAMAGHNYQWSISQGHITAGASTASIAVNWAQAGTGQVTLTETGNRGCQQTKQKPIAIRAKPAPRIELK